MFPVSSLRSQFPVLNAIREGRSPIFLDGPGGTQVPQQVIDAIVHYLRTCNANHGGVFRTSRESDAIVHAAHEAVADLLNAPSVEEIVFGPNMTTLTFHLSRAIGRTLKPGDEVLVTRLDHDANVSPWGLTARDAGATVKRVDIHPEDCTLDMEDFKKQLGSRTRLVALTCASNGVGTVNDVKTLTRLAHEVGAWVFLDAVHYAPHGLIDVQDWGCDFLACSAYKFFGPHIGILWGKRKLLAELPAYKVRPSSNALPDRWMTGTQNHECLAGVAAAVDYLAQIEAGSGSASRRARLCSAMSAIRSYERARGSTVGRVGATPPIQSVGHHHASSARPARPDCFHYRARSARSSNRGAFGVPGDLHLERQHVRPGTDGTTRLGGEGRLAADRNGSLQHD